MNAGRWGAVALVFVLAGCSTVSFGAGTPAAPTETLTPAPVDPQTATGAQTVSPPPAPPGVTLDGRVDVSRLRSSHAEYLDGRSYTWMLTYDANTSGTGMLDRQFSRRVRVDDDRYLAEQFGPGTSVDQTLYSDGSAGYLRVGTDNGSRFTHVANPGAPDAYAIGSELVWRYLTGVNLSVDVVETGGQTYFRLYSIDRSTPVALRGFTTTVTNYRVTAYVTPAGLVKSLIVEYDRTHTNTTQHVTVRYDYNAIGRTDVPRPDWVSQVTPRPGETPTHQPPRTTASPPPIDAGRTSPVGTATPVASGTVNETQTSDSGG